MFNLVGLIDVFLWWCTRLLASLLSSCDCRWLLPWNYWKILYLINTPSWMYKPPLWLYSPKIFLNWVNNIHTNIILGYLTPIHQNKPINCIYHKMICCYLFIFISTVKFNLILKNMEWIFWNKKTCLVNRCYNYFLRSIQINKLKSSSVDPQKMHFELYTKCTENINGSQLGHLNCIPIPLCTMELIQSLAPDKSGRYTDFWYANGKMINQLDACHLEDDKISYPCGITW